VAQKRFFDPFPYDDFAHGPAEPGTEAALPAATRARLRSHYQAALHSADHHLGTVLARLEELGLAGNTVVVVFGDHGYLLGERENRYGKGVLWDEALRTALLLRVPGSRAPAVVDLPVGLVDLYPTLVELAGLPFPAVPLDGRSFAGLFQGRPTGHPGRVYSYGTVPMRAGEPSFETTVKGQGLEISVRTAEYRYTEGPHGRNPELIDVRADPHAWRNLAGDPAHSETVRSLRALLRPER
jgi:arylsulfatase A-like enzyme